MQETAAADSVSRDRPPWTLPLSPLARARAGWLATSTAIIAAGAYLRFHRLGEGGLGNSFYAAAVRSMQESVHNFFFVAFDPLGTYMVDKPPVGLWLQALSARLLGYDGFALMLPQAVGGVLTIAFTLFLVRRLHGYLAALFAAATLAVLPASVLVARNNTMDSAMVAVVMAGLLATARAADAGRLAWLLLAAFLAGLAFNIKGFEALLALPGALLFFVVASKLPVRTRLCHLLVAGVIFVVVALSWTAAVGLYDAGSRPIVLNSDGNSIWSLTFGYNGLDRIFGGEGFNPANAMTSQNPDIVPLGVLYGGETGPLRLLGEFPGPLIALMLPTALAGAGLLLYDFRYRERRAGTVLWLSWLAGGSIAFSTSRLGSAHYLESFAPAVAACCGVALASLVQGGLLRRVVALAGVAGSAGYTLDRFGLYSDIGGTIEWLMYAAIAASVAATVFTVILRSRPAAAAVCGVAAGAFLLAAPALVSRESVTAAPVEGVLPGTVYLSLDGSRAPRLNLDQPTYYFITGRIDYLARPLAYLDARRREGQYAAANTSFYTAAAIIAYRNLPMLPLYSEFRTRAEMPVERLHALIDEGRLQYFMVSLPRLESVHPEAASLVRARCTDVSREAGAVPQIGVQVYRCQ